MAKWFNLLHCIILVLYLYYYLLHTLRVRIRHQTKKSITKKKQVPKKHLGPDVTIKVDSGWASVQGLQGTLGWIGLYHPVAQQMLSWSPARKFQGKVQGKAGKGNLTTKVLFLSPKKTFSIIYYESWKAAQPPDHHFQDKFF